jgi:hypothetical protein
VQVGGAAFLVGRHTLAALVPGAAAVDHLRTASSITGTSISTPTTVASAAPDWKPKSTMAVATASSKKLLAPISAEGPATQWGERTARLRR